MPVTSVTAQELLVGAGDLYVDGVAVGATMENNVWRLNRDYFVPKLNGVRGPLKGTDYIQSETAEIECTVPELTPANLALAVPGTASTSSTADGILTGASTQLDGASLAGATTLFVDSVASMAVGDVVQIGPSGSTREFRKLTRVGTALAAGTGIDVDRALVYAHADNEVVQEIVSTTIATADVPAGSTSITLASAATLAVADFVSFGYAGEREVRRLTSVVGAVVGFSQPTSIAHRIGDMVFEVTSEGTTRFQSTTDRRIADTDYHDFELRVPGLGGRSVRFGILDAIMTDNAEFEAKDDGTLAPRLKLQARWDPAAPTTPPWYIDRVGATS